MPKINKETLAKIRELLIRDYPLVATPLKHESSFQLVCATILSAQTLDDTVNKVTPTLFSRFPRALDLSKGNIEEVEKIIRIVNYHKTKAKNIIKMAYQIESQFGGVTPNQIDDLTTLSGVGRKTANVVISEWFAKPLSRRGNKFDVINIPPHFRQDVFVDSSTLSKGDIVFTEPQGFVVDTHVKRVAKRLGLTSSDDPLKIERDLSALFPKEEWPEMSLRLIFHGRYRCKARKCMCQNDSEWSKICRLH